MMMKRTLMLTLLAALSAAAMAQRAAGTFSIIPRVGVSLASLSGDAMYAGAVGANAIEFKSRYKAGFVGGVDFDYQVASAASVSLGAFFSQQGCRYGNDKAEVSVGGNTYKYRGFSDASMQLGYLNVPLMANFYITERFAVKCGVQLGVNLSGKLKYTETPYSVNENGEVEYEKPTEYKIGVDCKKVEFSIPVGVSYEYENVVIDARYNIGLSGTTDVVAVKSPKNQVVQFTVGYRFEL